MTNLSKYGVPLGGGKMSGIIAPLYRYRFRIAQCDPLVTQNIYRIDIDFVNQKIKTKIRATIQGEAFIAAQRFGLSKTFILEMMDGGQDGVYFGLLPNGLELTKYDLTLDYGDSSFVVHDMEWAFNSIDVVTPAKADEPAPEPTPGFMSVDEAISKLTDPNPDVTEVEDEIYRGDAGC